MIYKCEIYNNMTIKYEIIIYNDNISEIIV